MTRGPGSDSSLRKTDVLFSHPSYLLLQLQIIEVIYPHHSCFGNRSGDWSFALSKSIFFVQLYPVPVYVLVFGLPLGLTLKSVHVLPCAAIVETVALRC